MIEKYTLYVGLNDKDTKVQEIATLEAYKIINKLLLNYTDGATIFEAVGIYKHEDGSFVTENTLRIELMFIEKSAVKEIVENIKKILNQESVAVQREVVESELW
jgi:uncharacterized membrane-anchored protein YitT (DUF2179 family)